MRKHNQQDINSRVKSKPIFSDKQPYYREPRGDSWVSTYPVIRPGITGGSGISSRLGSPASGGGISGGTSGVSGVSGNVYAAGGGTVTLYYADASGQLLPDVAVSVLNALGAAVPGNKWVYVGWDSTSRRWWVVNAEC